MHRREFIAVFGTLAAGWPLAVRAQPAKLPMIGILLTGNPEPEVFLKGFRDALSEAGYADGQNIRLEVRSAEGNSSLLEPKAAELVALKVDIIVASLTPAIQAAMQATADIPIVMAPAGEPWGPALWPALRDPAEMSRAYPQRQRSLSAKASNWSGRAMPSARRVAVLANSADPLSKPFVAQIEEGARILGLEVDTTRVRPETQLDAVFDLISSNHYDALIVQGSLQHKELFDLAIKHRLPSFSSNRQVATTGGLMTYAADSGEVQRGAVGYVDKILKGAKPADLPVMQPTKFELVINLKTAKVLGFTVPPALLARADEVIE